MNRNRRITLALVAALVAPQLAVAADPQWSALLAFDDGPAPEMLRIAADSETACLAELSSYRDALLIEPCQPAASAITDPNDANRTAKGPKPAQPSGGGGGNTGGGTGSSGGGAGGGGVGGW